MFTTKLTFEECRGLTSIGEFLCSSSKHQGVHLRQSCQTGVGHTRAVTSWQGWGQLWPGSYKPRIVEVLTHLAPGRWCIKQNVIFEHMFRIKLVSTGLWNRRRWMPQNTFDDINKSCQPKWLTWESYVRHFHFTFSLIEIYLLTHCFCAKFWVSTKMPTVSQLKVYL